MKTLLLLFVALGFTLPLTANAASPTCRQEAIKAAGTTSTPHLVVSFEGLASYFAGYVRRNLIVAMEKKAPGSFVSKNYSYTSHLSAARCIQDWYAVLGSSGRISLIGHSFGGGIAVFKTLTAVSRIPIDSVITIDPRSWTTDREYRKTKRLDLYDKPGNVNVFLNFYQRGALPGYMVREARNVEVKNVSHTALPRNPTLQAEVTCVVLGVCR